MTRDWSSNTEDQAGISARMDAHPEVQDERDEPGTTTGLTHDHRPGVVCFSCCWLRARREHLGLVPDAEMAWCNRCADEYVFDTGCAHGLELCAGCLQACPECRADLEDAADDLMRERLRDWWGDGA